MASSYESYYQKLEKALYLSLEGTFKLLGYEGIQIWFSHTNSLEPTKTYCVINILEVEQIGREVGEFVPSEIEGEWQGDMVTPTSYRALVQFSVLGKSAEEIAPRLMSAMSNNRVVLDLFVENGLGGMYRSSLRNSPQTREGGYIPMLNFDRSFSFSYVETQEVISVRNIGVEGFNSLRYTSDYYDLPPIDGDWEDPKGSEWAPPTGSWGSISYWKVPWFDGKNIYDGSVYYGPQEITIKVEDLRRKEEGE